MKWFAVFGCSVLLGACSSLDLDPQAPRGFDLTGTWLLNPVLSDAPPSRADLKQRGGPGGSPGGGLRRPVITGLSFFPVMVISTSVVTVAP